MDEISVSGRMADQQVPYERLPYLATYRALAACSRELGRLSDALIAETGALAEALAIPKPIVRRPPGRCIIQIGPVALTFVWLQHALDSVATGELLVNVWHGNVSPRLHHRPERPDEERTRDPATLVWERVLTATADTESAWSWQTDVADAPSLSSAALASLCAEQVGLAYANATVPLEHS